MPGESAQIELFYPVYLLVLFCIDWNARHV